MAVDLIATQGLGVLAGVEHRLVVGGPRGPSGGQRNLVRQQLARGEVLEANRVLATAHGVHTEGDEVVVVAHPHAAHGEVIVPLGHLVLVEHDLLLTGAVLVADLITSRLAAVDGVFLALLVPGVVPVSAVPDRHAAVILLDAADDLIEERLLQSFRVGQLGIDVVVFRSEVIQHLLRLVIRCLRLLLGIAEAHPEIIVHPGVPVLGHFKRHLLGHRGHGIIGLGHVVGGLAGREEEGQGEGTQGAERRGAEQVSVHECELSFESSPKRNHRSTKRFRGRPPQRRRRGTRTAP